MNATPPPADKIQTYNEASIGQWVLAIVACIAFFFYLLSSEDSSHEMFGCSDERLKESVTSILEQDPDFEVLKLQSTSFKFPDVEVGFQLKDVYARRSCIALLYSNKGRHGLKVIVWQDAPNDEVFVEIAETSLHAAVEAISQRTPK